MSSPLFHRKQYIAPDTTPPRLLYDRYDKYLRSYMSDHAMRRSYQEIITTPNPETMRAYLLPARHQTSDTQSIVLCAGVHGNEAFGVTALTAYISTLTDPTHDNYRIHQEFHIIVFPALNPWWLRQCTAVNTLGQNTNRFVISKKDNTSNPVPHIDALYTIRNTIKKDNFLTDIMLALDLHGARLKDGFFAVTPSTSHIDKYRHQSHIDIIQHCFDIHSKFFPSYNPWKQIWYPLDVASSRNPEQVSYTMPCPGVAISLNYGTHKDFFLQQWAKYAYTLEYPGISDLTQRQQGLISLIETSISSCISFTKS